MSKHYGGGPVFPREGGRKFVVGNDVRVTTPHDGMTLRDYFAAKAMQSIISKMDSAQYNYTGAGSVASDAYAFADAMIKEREK